MARETMDFDVVIVGAGPAGLATACRLAQLARAQGRELGIAVLEKGAEVGAHILSGAVIDPRALGELFPDWQRRGAPLDVAVTSDAVHWLTSAHGGIRLPAWLVPQALHNRGHYVASLGRLCQWLAGQAEELGCNVFPGFAATEILYGSDGRVVGVATGSMGADRQGSPKPGFQAGYELRARYVVFAEGCRGSLGRQLEARFALRAGSDPQRYGIGFKEIWHVPPECHEQGTVVHTLGWPLDDHTEGGGFLYHAADRQVYLGFVVALSYSNPYLSPFEEFQRWKLHPRIRAVLDGATRLSYGARAVNKGGLQALPELVFPGGVLVGCEAGFLNPAKIKGSHTAIKSGMLAAEALFAELLSAAPAATVRSYATAVRESWVWEELHRARNVSPALAKFGTVLGAAFVFMDQALGGRWPLTLRHSRPDYATLRRTHECKPIEYPKPDGVLTFDRLTSVYLSNLAHDEDQPNHLRLADPDLPVRENLPAYDEPAQRYCPAAVYEIVASDSSAEFKIHAANCVHCKTCDIKDPAQNITWVPPEGGSGPNYVGM